MGANPRGVDFDVVLESDPSGGFAVSVPMLPGCFSQGHTRAEALHHIREAIEGYLEMFGLPDPPIVMDRVSVAA